jgi:hypothetical protein
VTCDSGAWDATLLYIYQFLYHPPPRRPPLLWPGSGPPYVMPLLVWGVSTWTFSDLASVASAMMLMEGMVKMFLRQVVALRSSMELVVMASSTLVEALVTVGADPFDLVEKVVILLKILVAATFCRVEKTLPILIPEPDFFCHERNFCNALALRSSSIQLSVAASVSARSFG